MKYKKFMCGALAAAMTVTCLSGCSKGKKERKIDGASDEANRFVNIIEEPYDMKGYKIETSMNIDSSANGGKASGKIDMTTLIDSKGNFKNSVFADAKIQNIDVKGEVASIYFVDDQMCFDLSPAYSVLQSALGAEQTALVLTQLGVTEDDLKANLCFTLSTGELKSSDFSPEKYKAIMQPLMDDYARALTTAKGLTVSDKVYTVDFSGDALKNFVTEFGKEFEKNGSVIYDALTDYIDSLKPETSLPSFINAVVSEAKKGLASTVGEDALNASLDDDLEKIKTQITDAVKALKDSKEDNLKKITDALKGVDGIEDASGANVKFTLKDEDDGYVLTLPASLSGNIGGMSGSVSGTADIKISSSGDTVKIPSGAVTFASAIEKIGGVYAAQYLRYIEKSREAADKANLSAVIEALKTSLCDEDVYSKASEKGAVVIDENGNITCSDEVIIKAIEYVIGTENHELEFKSQKFKGKSFTINYSFDKDIYCWNVDDLYTVTAGLD